MEELRSEIRAAFEREQAANPPVAGLRRNIVQAVIIERRQAPNLQWLAIAAAILLGILVVAGLMATRLAYRGGVPAGPPATPVADYGPPPLGVPLIYLQDPHHSTWLVGYDWSGKPRGTVKLSLAGVQQSPDGVEFTTTPSGKGGSGPFLDRFGQPIPGAPGLLNTALGMWADDNRHLCWVTLDQQTFEWGLSTQLPGAAAKTVAVIARDQGIGQTGIAVVGCSWNNDRAILVRTTISSPSELWVMRMSDGAVLSHQSYQPNVLASITASRDAIYVAENSAIFTPGTPPAGAAVTVVRRVSDWSPVSAVDGIVEGFSADDSLILVTGPTQATTRVLNLKTGGAVWFHLSDTLLRFLADPNGGAFVLALETNPTPACVNKGCPHPLKILIVRGNGSTTTIPGAFPAGYVLAW